MTFIVAQKRQGDSLNIKVLSYQCSDFHYKDQTVRPSYLYNTGNVHTWKERLNIETGLWCVVWVQVLVCRIGSDNSLAPPRCQGNIWTNGGPVYWHTYASVGAKPLTYLITSQLPPMPYLHSQPDGSTALTVGGYQYAHHGGQPQTCTSQRDEHDVT